MTRTALKASLLCLTLSTGTLPTPASMGLALAQTPTSGLSMAAQDEDEFEFLESSSRSSRQKDEELPDKASFSDFGDEPDWEMEEDMDMDDMDDFEPDENFDDFEDPGPTTVRATPSNGLPDAGDLLPLEDNYPLKVVAKDLDSIVVELPILVGRSHGDYAGEDFWVIAQVLVDGKKAGESRQLVTSATMAELGPTFTWIKAFASVSSTQGTVEIRVSKADTEWTEEITLFTRAGEYRL